jgi:hypothetical protein
MPYDFSDAANIAEFPIPERFEEPPIVCPVCGEDGLDFGLVIEWQCCHGFEDVEVQIKIVKMLRQVSVGLVGERRLIRCYCSRCNVERLLQITQHEKGTAYVAWKTSDANLLDDLMRR